MNFVNIYSSSNIFSSVRNANKLSIVTKQNAYFFFFQYTDEFY